MVDPVLTRLPLFSDLAEAEIESVSAVMGRRRYAKGSLIHAAGTMGADFYVIESGRVKIQLTTERGEALTLRLLVLQQRLVMSGPAGVVRFAGACLPLASPA